MRRLLLIFQVVKFAPNYPLLAKKLCKKRRNFALKILLKTILKFLNF